MLDIQKDHYIDTVLYSIDRILKGLKIELKNKLETLNIGITGEQFIVLDTICGIGNIYQQQLSEIIMKDKSNTNRILKILEQKNLITKEFGNVNNRLVYFLRPTKEGKKLVDENMPKIKQFITDIFINIDNSEIEILHKLSRKFQADLSEII